MVTLTDILFLISTITIGLFGFILNSWIVTVNMKDYRAGIRLSPCDQILTLIGLTNLLLQSVLSWCSTTFVFKPHVESSETYYLIHIMFLIFLVVSNFWLTLWLSAFYFLKILNFKRGIFFVLKLRFSEFLPKLLVFSFAESLLFAIPAVWAVSIKSSHALLQNMNSTDISMKSQTLVTVDYYYFVIVFLKSIILLTFTIIPIRLTVLSLIKHVRRMKKNDFSAPQMDAHITATRSIILLVLFYTFFYTSIVCILFKSFIIDDILGFWLYIVTYPTAQATVIITGNSKLKTAAKCVQKHLENMWNCET